MNTHGLNKDFVDKILKLGFEDKALTFYNTERKQINLDNINGFAKILKWATNDIPKYEYLFINGNGIFKVVYSGNATATVDKLADASENSLILVLELLKSK